MILSLLLPGIIPAIAYPGFIPYDHITRLTGKGGWYEARESVVDLFDYSGSNTFL